MNLVVLIEKSTGTTLRKRNNLHIQPNTFKENSSGRVNCKKISSSPSRPGGIFLTRPKTFS